ncbi:MAG: hypothetical protein E7517_09275 [Ruminococcaceae bacterium]|nr:hypothetical protein [Oscillospiraceae bacterium]
MAKKLYSLMLNDRVVAAVDSEAHRLGTNRSALIDSVLAEYFGVPTTQKMVSDIFREMDALLSDSADLIPFFAPNSGTFFVKSALAYKYRPTLKYELVFDTSNSNKLGDLSVNFRTQSGALLQELERFFRVWAQVESEILEGTGAEIHYSLFPNRFTRSITLAQGNDYAAQQIAEAVSAYVNLLDASLKAFINAQKDEDALKRDYLNYLKTTKIIL